MLEYKNLETLVSTGKFLVALLAAVLNETEIPPLPADVTWENVYDLAKQHSVESMAFYGARSRLLEDSELYIRWRKKRDQNIVQGITQLEERNEIYRKFKDAGIRFLPLKGCKLKELYRQIDFRQMSDLDILIEPENADKAKCVMESMGYHTGKFGEKHDDEYFKPPYMHVEIHRQMLPDNVPKHVYYDNIWEKAVPDPEIPGGWKLTPEDFYIYYLAHFEKHFNEMGSGIRSLLDIYVYLQDFQQNMDRNYIEKELKVLNMSHFCREMEALSFQWFSEGEKWNIKATREMEETQRNLFLAGIYGSRDFTKARSMDMVGIEGGMGRSFVYVLKRIFMSREEFGYAYPITQKHPALIPLFWFYRIFDVLAHKRASIKKEIELFRSKKGKL